MEFLDTTCPLKVARERKQNRNDFPYYVIIEHFDEEKLYYSDEKENWGEGEEVGDTANEFGDWVFVCFQDLINRRRRRKKLMLRGKSFACFRRRYYMKRQARINSIANARKLKKIGAQIDALFDRCIEQAMPVDSSPGVFESTRSNDK